MGKWDADISGYGQKGVNGATLFANPVPRVSERLLTAYRHPVTGCYFGGLGVKALAGAAVHLQYLYRRQHLGLKAHQLAQIRQRRVPARSEMPALPAVDGLVRGRG